MENLLIPGRIQMVRFIMVEIFPEKKKTKSNTFLRYYLFPVFTETTEIFHTICLVNQCQASSWGGRWKIAVFFQKGYGVLQMVQL